MSKAEIYPWIFAVVFGIVGVIVCALIGYFYENFAGNAVWTAGPYTGGWHNPNNVANIFFYTGTISFTVLCTAIIIVILGDDAWEMEGKKVSTPVPIAALFGFFGTVFVWFLMCAAIADSPLNGISFSSLIGVFSGAIISILNKKSVSWGIAVTGIFGVIIGGNFHEIGFIVSLPVVPAFASIGYAVGNPIAEKAEQRAETKGREKLERKGRIREEERRRLEYEQKIRGYKSKVEQWEREGYDVSKLKKRWFK